MGGESRIAERNLDVFGLWHVVESTHEHRLAITGDQRLTRRGIVEHPGQRTGLPGSDRGQLIVIIPVALGLLLNVVMHRGKLVETLMTEATVVGARID